MAYIWLLLENCGSTWDDSYVLFGGGRWGVLTRWIYWKHCNLKNIFSFSTLVLLPPPPGPLLWTHGLWSALVHCHLSHSFLWRSALLETLRGTMAVRRRASLSRASNKHFCCGFSLELSAVGMTFIASPGLGQYCGWLLVGLRVAAGEKIQPFLVEIWTTGDVCCADQCR